MKRRFFSSLLYLVALPTLMSGCGRPEQAPVVKQAEKPVELGKLPNLGDSIGPLDNGRIMAAPPENWTVPSRKTGFVVRFVESDRLMYPKIHVTATDYENTINVDEFARQVADALQEDEKVTKLTEPVTPVEIGRLVGVTHARRAKDPKGRVVERAFIETVVAGRKYTVELQARRGTLRTYRPHLHAVAGGIEFLEPQER